MRPNVILIVLDTARADAFEPYGAAAGSTPAIADLAGAGTASESTHAAACWTVPSHAAMFTGLLPRAAGLARAPGGLPHGCRPVLEAQRDRLLPEVLRRSGYSTAGVSTNLWITPESGFATGFEEFVTVDTARQGQLSHTGVRSRARWLAEGLRSRVDDGAEAAGAALRGWIAQPPTRPFFWFVNLVECHSPYLPPKPYNDLGPLDRLRAAEEARAHLTLGEIWKACAGGFDVPADALERMRHLYGRSIVALDAWVGRVAEALDEAALLDETLLVITSDHGENLGERGLMGHAFSLDERLLHVPFVAVGPGATDAPPPASLVDLPSWIASVAGLDGHPWAEPPPERTAVAQFDPPAPAGDPRVREAVDAWGLGDEAAGRISTPLDAAVAGGFKLLRRGDREELFDLEADPFEERPLAPDGIDDEIAGRLRGAIAEAATASVPAPAEPTSAEEPDPEELAKLEERMRLLGYM